MKTPPWITLTHRGLDKRVDRVPACLLFIDPQQGNAETLARLYMAAVLCQAERDKPCGKCQSCHLFSKNAHPDAIFLTEPGKIGDIRLLIQKTALTPTIAARRIIFLGKIDGYNDFALSALLKTLEEPLPHSAFILGAANRRAVKSTIISRAQIVHAPQPRPGEARDWLIGQGMPATVSERALLITHGNPYAALAASQVEKDDPLSLLEALALYCAAPRRHIDFLRQIDELPKEEVVDRLCLNLEQLAFAKQLDSPPGEWQNSSLLARSVPEIDSYALHRLYARLCRLRRPDRKQINQALSGKTELLELLNPRIKTL